MPHKFGTIMSVHFILDNDSNDAPYTGSRDTYLTRVRDLQCSVLRIVGPVTYSSPCTTTRSGAPLGGGASGGPGSIPGRFWRTGVPSFRRLLGKAIALWLC